MSVRIRDRIQVKPEGEVKQSLISEGMEGEGRGGGTGLNPPEPSTNLHEINPSP